MNKGVEVKRGAAIYNGEADDDEVELKERFRVSNSRKYDC